MESEEKKQQLSGETVMISGLINTSSLNWMQLQHTLYGLVGSRVIGADYI